MSLLRLRKSNRALKGASLFLTVLFAFWAVAPQQQAVAAAPTAGTEIAVSVTNTYDANGNLVTRVDGNGIGIPVRRIGGRVRGISGHTTHHQDCKNSHQRSPQGKRAFHCLDLLVSWICRS